jgi:hypothetical protein
MRDCVQNTYFSGQPAALPGDIYAAQGSLNIISALWYDESGAEILRPGMAVALIPSASSDVPAGVGSFACSGIDFVALPLPASASAIVQLGIVIRNQVGGSTCFDGSSDDRNSILNGSMIDVMRVERGAQVYLAAMEGAYTATGLTTAVVGFKPTGTPGDTGRVTTSAANYPVKAELLDTVTVTPANRSYVPVPVRFLSGVGE